MARLMPVLTCLFWMVAFAAVALIEIMAEQHADGTDIWPAMILPAVAGAAALGFGWLALVTSALPKRDCAPSDMPPHQLIFGFALAAVAMTMIWHLPEHGLRAIIDGGLVASGLIASFLLIEKAMPVELETSPARLPALQASHLAALAVVVGAGKEEGERP